MARVTDDLPGGGLQGSQAKVTHIDIDDGGAVKVPSAGFIADADIARDGQDLVLTAPDGSVVVIDGYFLADPAPMIAAPDGTTLTPQLVESFAHGAGPVQYAQAGTLSDVTPVGAVQEVSGKATVTHPDGTSENIVIGTAIYQGDVIETGGGSAVEIKFIDESSFAVSSNARLAIDEFVFDPSTQGGESNFSMLRGMFVYTSGLIGREDPDDVNIGTPVGSIGIRGTTIAGNVDTGEITVVEGAIVLRSLNGEEVTLADHFGTAQFLPNGNVVQLPDVTPDDLGAKFASMNSVAPAFFTTIDNAEQQQSDDAGDAGEDGDNGETQGESAAPDAGAAPAPADSQVPGESAADPAADPASETILMDDGEGFEGEADAFSGEIDSFADAAGNAGSESLLADAPAVDAGTFAPPPAADTAPSDADVPPPPPPPPPVNTGTISTTTLGIAENSAVSAAVGAVATADMTAPVFAETGNGTGAGIFNIDTAGNITVQTAGLDFETLAFYTYEVQATDTDGTVATRLLTINLGNVDDTAPTLPVNAGLTINEGDAPIQLTTAKLAAADVDTSNANIIFTVVAPPANGAILKLSGVTLVATDTFTMQDVIDGLVTVEHNGSEAGGAGDFTFSVSDGTNAGPGGQVFSITINAVNDAPVLDNTGSPILTAIAEDTVSPAGDLVSSIVGAAITDAEGITDAIAVTAVDNTNGTWQYSTDSGTTWNAVAPVSNTNALLLNGAAMMRFVPGANFDGNATFTFKAWDQSTGTIGSHANTTGGSTAFSTAVETAQITVTPDSNIENDGGTYTGIAGDDFITVSGDNNTVSAVVGDDTITVTATATGNTLQGGDHDDNFIVAATGNNIYDGGTDTAGDFYNASAVTGNMTMTVNAAGAATASSISGTDTLTNIEMIWSGSGNDAFVINDANALINFDAGTGSDLLDFSALGAGNPVTVSISTGAVTVSGGSSGSAVNFENVTGSAGADTIYGATDANANVIDGGAGNDALTGSNNDTLLGGAGADILSINSDANITVNGGTGGDTLRFSDAGTYDTANLGGLTGVETIETLIAAVNLTLQANTALFANDTGNLTINLDSDDTLSIDFSSFGGGGAFNLVSGNLTNAGTAEFLNTTTGNSIFINYVLGATITETGAGGAGVLYLNTLSASNGFKIVDDIAEGFGHALAGLGDVDGDGFDDIGMVKFSNPTTDGRVFILDGQAGGYGNISVSAFPGTVDTGLFNTSPITNNLSLAAAGDFNGDGVADYIVGAPMADSVSGSTSGNIEIIDGATGATIITLDGLNSMDLSGVSIAGVGDINGDGFADVVIGAPNTDNNGSDSGSAYILFGGDYAPATVIDVTTMGGPSFAGDLSTPFNADAKDIEIFEGGPAGTVGFVMKNNGQIDVVNVEDPSASFIHGVSPLDNAYIAGLPGYAGDASPMNGLVDIVVKDNFLYILSGSVNSATQGQITVLDISDPVNPVFVDSFTHANLLNVTAIDVDLVAGHLAVTAGGGGNNAFYLIAAQNDGIISGPGVGDGGVIGSLGAMTPLTGANEIILNGNFAYIVTALDPDGGGAALPGTLQVVNISTPSTPSIGTQINIENIKNVFFDSVANKLYVISSTGGTGQVSVYSTSTPGNPSFLGSSAMNASLGNATDIVVRDGVAFVTTPGGVQAVDVSNPGSITMIGALPNPGSALDEGMALTIDSAGFLHVVSGGANDTLASVDLLPLGLRIDGATASDLLGMSVTAAGDFNNDGFADFMVSSVVGGAGEAAIIYGNPEVEANGINMANAVRFTGIVIDGNNEVPVMSMGDLNGDGISDVGMFAMGANAGDGQLYVMFGGAYAPGSTQTAAASADLIISAPGAVIEAANGIGDFNGDGFDDMAVVMRSGTDADIYVVYGSATLGGTYNLAMLDNPANAFHMTYTIPTGADPNTFNFNVSGAGDVDGDGFYDLLIGLPDADNDAMSNSDGAGTNTDDSDGSAILIYGRDTGIENAAGSIIQTGTTANAAATGDVIVGSDSINALGDGGLNDVSFRAGAGDDIINLSNGNFNNIDGGGGWDVVDYTNTGSIDFTTFNAEDIRRVEELDMSSGSAQTMILNMQNIFSLLGSSDAGVLTISGSVTDTLQIDHAGPTQAGADQQQIAQLLGADSWAYNGTDSAYDFTFGGYVLQISQNLVDNSNVDVV